MRNTLKQSLIIVFLYITIQSINAQNIILSEPFANATFPPNGWTIDNHAANWSYSNTTNAGGNQGEALLSGYPDFIGVSRFVSPVIDLSNASNVSLEFKHSVYFSSSIPGYGVIGVATRSGNGSWTSIWEVNDTASITSQTISLPLNNSDANASDFQFCFYFDGTSYISDWSIDDINIYNSSDHDIKVVKILGNSVVELNEPYQPMAVIKNVGLNTESFDVICSLYDENDLQLFTDTQTVSGLLIDSTDTVTFSSDTLSNVNALYKVVVSSNLGNDQNTSNDSLLKNIYTYTTTRNQVLLEIGTGTWCHLCQGAALAAENLKANGKDVAIVEYHNGDDFSTTTGQSRLDYYGIVGYPTAFFDGVLESLGGSESSIYSDYLPLYVQRKAVNTGVNIDLSETHTNANYTVSVNLSKVGPIADTNTVLFLTLTESDINFSWQSQTKLDFVQRLTLPNAEGQAIDLANNNSLSIPFSFQIDTSWTNKLEVLVFIENKDTREILNAAKLSIVNPLNIKQINNVSNNITIYPNPASDLVTIKSESNISEVNIIDITGKVIKRQNMSKGENTLDVSRFVPGFYTIALYDGNKLIARQKLIIK